MMNFCKSFTFLFSPALIWHGIRCANIVGQNHSPAVTHEPINPWTYEPSRVNSACSHWLNMWLRPFLLNLNRIRISYHSERNSSDLQVDSKAMNERNMNFLSFPCSYPWVQSSELSLPSSTWYIWWQQFFICQWYEMVFFWAATFKCCDIEVN